MKRSLSIVLALLMVMSTFALWTITASADAEIVQDGLVSWFDGNDYEGTTWIDKKGINDITDCVDGTFKDGAYVLDKAQQLLPNELYDVIRGEEFTVEINLGEFETYPDTGYATWLCNNSGTTAEKVSFYIQLNKGSMDTFKAKTSGISSSARPSFNDATATLQDATLTITFKAGGATCVYVNGELMSSANSPADNANAAVGASPKFILGNAGVNNCSNTAFEGLRFYNRELTADEVKNNADVDNTPAQIIDPPVEPEGPKEIELSSFNGGWENWENSPNKGDYPFVTQLLIVAPFDSSEEGATAYTWKLTIGDKTIELVPASNYDFGNGTAIWRFETCFAEGDNQFIPVAGESYVVSAEIYNGDELVYVAEAGEGASWDVPADLVPVLPTVDPVDPPATGDATVVAIVFAVVALMGMGVVVTKKVRA